MEKIKVLISDGGRHKVYSGYGDHSRSFALALLRDERFQVKFLTTNHAWQYEGPEREELESIETINHDNECDIVLQIGTPNTFKKSFKKPSILSCHCDLSDLAPESIEVMQGAGQAIITSSRSSKKVFERYMPKVYLAPLVVNPQIFKPVPKWRPEGFNRFSFIFVGSFSFRKGIDLLIDAFFQEFSWEEVNLHLHCPAAKADELGNFIIKKSQEYQKIPMMSFSTKSITPAWMNRFYNRADAFVSFTRGEGWGLPIAEAMHCGLPVIAPLSTSMLDFLNKDVAFCLPTQEKLLANITDSFGYNFKKNHANSGNSYQEIDIEQAKKTLRYVFENRDKAKEFGEKGQIHMLKNFPFEKMSDSVCNAILDFVESSPKKKVIKEIA